MGQRTINGDADAYRKAIKRFKKENPYCIICGPHSSDEKQTVHHLIEYSLGGSTTNENNLVTLCERHHKLVEQGKITISRYL